MVTQESMNAAMQGAAPPGLSSVREAVLAEAREKGRQNVTCDDVSPSAEGEGLMCYHGNQIAMLGQAGADASEGMPLLVASFGDNMRREIRQDGVYLNGNRISSHFMGKPSLSMMRAQQLFCEAISGGNASSLQKISNPGTGEGQKAVPAIYYPEPESEKQPRIYKT